MGVPAREPLVTSLVTQNIGRLGIQDHGLWRMDFEFPVTVVVARNAKCKTSMADALRAAVCANDNPMNLSRHHLKDYIHKHATSGTVTATFQDGTKRTWRVGDSFIQQGDQVPPLVDALVAGIDRPMEMTSKAEIQKYWSTRFRVERFTPAAMREAAVARAAEQMSEGRARKVAVAVASVIEDLMLPEELDANIVREQLEKFKQGAARSFATEAGFKRGGPRISPKMFDHIAVATQRLQESGEIPTRETINVLEDKLAELRVAQRQTSQSTLKSMLENAQKELLDQRQILTNIRLAVDNQNRRLTEDAEEVEREIKQLTERKSKLDKPNRREGPLTPDFTCPSCQTPLVVDQGIAKVFEQENHEALGRRMELNSTHDMLAADIKEKRDLAQGFREEIQANNKKVERANMDVNVATRTAENLEKEMEKAHSDDKIPSREDVERMQEEVKRARDRYEEGMALAKQDHYANLVGACECMLHAVSPEGGLSGGSNWVMKLNETIRKIGEIAQTSLTVPQMDESSDIFMIDGLSLQKASMSERWHAQAVLQMAMAARLGTSQPVMVIFDGADILYDDEASALFRLLGKFVAKRANISAVVTATGTYERFNTLINNSGLPEVDSYFKVETLT